MIIIICKTLKCVIVAAVVVFAAEKRVEIKEIFFFASNMISLCIKMGFGRKTFKADKSARLKRSKYDGTIKTLGVNFENKSFASLACVAVQEVKQARKGEAIVFFCFLMPHC